MPDLALDATGGLAVRNGDLALTTGVEEVSQHLRVRLRLFLGEWFLDTRLGVSYYEDVFKKNPDLGAIEALFKQTILDTPGVEAIERFTLETLPATRSLSVRFTVRAADGEVTLEEVVTP